MKTLISNYTFNKTAKTITFTDYVSISLDRLLIVTNVTANTILYLFADSTKGGTVSTNVLTLAFDTSAMNNGDKLQIYYDSVDTPATETSTQALLDMVGLLKRIAEFTSVLDVTDSQDRLRVNVDASAALNVNRFLVQPTDLGGNSLYGGLIGTSNTFLYAIPDVWHNVDQSRDAYANCIRNKLTFS